LTADAAPSPVRTAGPDGPAARPRNFRLLLTAFVVSYAGDWLYKLALPILVLQLTGSALQTAVVYSLEYVPYLLFAGIGGVISDRYDRRILLICSNSGATVVSGVLAGLAWAHQYHLWSIYLCAFLLSSFTPLYQASFLASVPAVVQPDRLGRANSRLQAGQGMLDLLGPIAGAAAVAALGARWALSLDSSSFALSALCIAMIARTAATRPQSAAGRTMVGDLKDAAAFVRATPALFWGAALAAGSSFGLSMVEANMITYLVHVRHQPIAEVGVVFAALGVGSLIGALVAPVFQRRMPAGPLIICSVIVGGLGTAVLLVLRQVATISAAWVLVGASTAVFIVTYSTLRHQLVPANLLGRVVVLTRITAYISVPVAPLIGGVLLSGVHTFWPVITVSAGAQVVIAFLALFSPLRTAA
jgi:MFS family permease